MIRGRGSGGERLTHIQEVGGSNPLVPTNINLKTTGFSLCGLILFLTKMFSVSSDALCRFIKTGKNSSSHMRSNLLKTGAERFIVLSLKVVFFFLVDSYLSLIHI